MSNTLPQIQLTEMAIGPQGLTFGAERMDPGGGCEPAGLASMPIVELGAWFDDREVCSRVQQEIRRQPLDPAPDPGACGMYLAGRCGLCGHPCAFHEERTAKVWRRAAEYRPMTVGGVTAYMWDPTGEKTARLAAMDALDAEIDAVVAPFPVAL